MASRQCTALAAHLHPHSGRHQYLAREPKPDAFPYLHALGGHAGQRCLGGTEEEDSSKVGREYVVYAL